MATRLPQVMRAAQFSGTPLEKTLRINLNAALPKTATSLKPNTVLVNVTHASLNPIEVLLLDGPMRMMLPATPGLDFAGKVVDSKLSSFKVGDEVFGTTGAPAFGALADYAVVAKAGISHAPKNTTASDLSTLGTAALAAYQGIAPFVKAGDKVLINGGSGGVGTFAIQIAKALGAEVTTICSAANAALCRSLGAKVIEYTAGDVVQSLKQNSVEYDLIFDTVFSNFSLYWQAHHYLREGGRYLTCAGKPGLSLMSNVTAIYLLPKALGGGQRPFQFVIATPKQEDYDALANLVASGKIKPVIENMLRLESAGQGYAKLKTGHTRGKTVIQVADEL